MHQAAAEGVETPGPWSKPGLWWGNKSLEVGGGKRRGGGRGTDFSFKAKGELCQLTASACAGPLTWSAVGADSSRVGVER